MIIITAVLLALSTGDYDADPYEIFIAGDSILSTANSFRYSFRFSGTGALANIIPAVSGRASLSLPQDSPHPLMVLDFLLLESQGSGEAPALPISYVASRDSLYRFGFSDSTVISGPVSAGGTGIFDYPSASVMMELVLDNPFSDEIMADSIAVLVPDTAGGEFCHVFHVYYHGGEAEAVWYISMDDLLPRAVERLSPGGGEFLEIWDLEHNSGLLETGETAPEVFLSDAGGFVRRIDFPRERPVMLLFFTSGGANSMAALGTAGEATGGNIEVYGISMMETGDLEFRLGSLDIPFTVLIHGEEAAEDYRVDVLPSAVLISPQGEVVMSAEGRDEIESERFSRALREMQ